jgi:hypothetical protein
MKTLIAFKGRESVKEKYITRVTAHQKSDEIIKGRYWLGGKGCAVGCTIHGNSHEKYETELGIPRAIARLEDRIFEGMSNKKAKEFPLQFLSSIEVGADLSKVLPRFYVKILTDKKHGVHQWARPDGKIAIKKVSDLFQELADGNEVTREEWLQAKAAADAAAYAAADAAAAAAAAAADAAADAAAYAAYAADADAYTAADAAAYAAYAADADAAAAARTKHFDWMADVLIKILKSTHAK